MIKRRAFTLAETLITLVIIGVVAALTIPSLMQQLGNYALEKQKDVFSKKWAEGLRQMRVDGKLEEKYATTADFVNEMQKYFKIQTVCASNNIAGCFTKQINASTRSFEADEMTTAKYFSNSLGDYDNPVGVKMADGTSMVIIYKKNCIGPSDENSRGNLTECIGYIYDVNNEKSPNKMNGDVASNLPLYPYGLSFEILNNKAYHDGDCETSTNGSEVCYNGGDAEEFCEAIGGQALSWEQQEQMNYTVYDEEVVEMFYAFGRGEEVNLPETVNINNQPLLSLFGLTSGTHLTVHGAGNSWNYYADLETGLKDLTGQTVNRDNATLCAVKE